LADHSRSSRARKPSPAASSQVLVVGLGRFGSAVAEELTHLGYEVLGIDADARRVQHMADTLTHALEADTTSVDVLEQIGARDFDNAVVGIGSDIEASILTTAALADAGVPNIIAKAVTDAHGRILERVGAHTVVYPEKEMGRRVAHLVVGSIIDWFQLDPNFAMVETLAPEETLGKTLADLELRARYGVTVVCVKPGDAGFTYATADTILERGDVLVVAGPSHACETFARMS
jgi:trk system potassium uptake protein TrkA